VVAQTGKHFPGGFFFHGYVRILGFEALADIIINPMQQFFVNVSIDPLNLAGVFVVQRSASDSSLGPIVTIDVKYGLLSLIPKVRVLIAGYVNLLGISAEVEITVDNSGYHLFLESKFLGLFRASIWVDASYGSLESVSFRVRAEMEQDFFAAINKKVQEALDEAKRVATKAFDDAQADVNAAKEKVGQFATFSHLPLRDECLHALPANSLLLPPSLHASICERIVRHSRNTWLEPAHA